MEGLRLYERNKNYELVDSLSYVDNVPLELEQTVKDLVSKEMNLILSEFGGTEEELLDKYLEPLPFKKSGAYGDNLYELELNRIEKGKEMDKLDLGKYNDTKQSLEHAKMLMEYSQNALINLELLDRYKEGIWLKHLDSITLLKLKLERECDVLRGRSEDLNKRRKLSQIEFSGQDKSITQEYEDYRNKNKILLETIEQLQQQRAKGDAQ